MKSIKDWIEERRRVFIDGRVQFTSVADAERFLRTVQLDAITAALQRAAAEDKSESQDVARAILAISPETLR